MLLNVHVKNLALIDEVEMNFSDHLNILTGETGAGKSVLIDVYKRQERENMARGKTLEAAFEEMDSLIAQMENKETSLEESFKLYTAGMKLIKSVSYTHLDVYKRQVSAAIGLWIFGGSAAWAVDKADEPDYSQIENVMEEILPEKMEFSFSQLVSRLVDGDFRGIFDSIKDEILSRMVYEVRSSRRMLIQMVGIICISAVFTNFSMAFSRTFIAETGYYLTYMVLFTPVSYTHLWRWR